MAAQPRAPLVFNQKSGTLDFPDSYQRLMRYQRDALIRQGAAELQACVDLQKVEEYIHLLDGSWYDDTRPEWRSHFSDNYLSDARIESISSLTDIRPAMDISCKVEAYKDQARIALDLIKILWQRDGLSAELEDWIDHSLLVGTGFWKIVGYEPGVLEVSAHALGTVIPVQMEGRKMQTAAAVIYRTYKSLAYFMRKFGPDKAEPLRRYTVTLAASMAGDKYNRPDNIPEYQWNTLSPAMKRRMSMTRNGPGKDTAGYSHHPYPIIELDEIYSDDFSVNDFGHPVLVKHPELSVEEHNYHYIVPPGGLLYPRKRLTVWGGDDILYDGPSPFWDGMYPFVMLQLNPCVWAPGGISKYRDMVPLNRSLNKIGAGVDETVMDAVNRTVVTKRGVIDAVSWDKFNPSMPKQKVMLSGTAQPANDFRYMDAKVLPPYVGEWMRAVDQRIRQKQGSLDIGKLSGKKQVPGGDTLENMREAMSGKFRLEGRHVEDALCEAALIAVSRIFQFFTTDQKLRYLGADGQTWDDYDYQAGNMVPAFSPKEDHWKLFSVQVAQGSMHGSSKFQKKVEAFTLRRGGDLDRKTFFKLAEVPANVDEVEANLKRERQEGVGPMPMKQQRQTRGQKTGSPL